VRLSGYDRAYGARPLKRAIQRLVLDPLATKILGELESPTEPAMSHDTSTTSLIRRYRASKL